MFEQAVITERKRPWTMAVSVTLQSAFVGSIVVLSMLNIERLPDVVLPTPLPPLPAAPRPVEIIATEITRTARAAITALNTFTEPVRIPARVNMIEDPPSAGVPVAAGGIPNTGFPPGMYTVGESIISRAVQAPPPPSPAATKRDDRAAQEIKRVTLGGVVLEGKLIKRVIPEYPVLARQMRISGKVRLMGIVTRDGLVRDLKVIEGHPLLVPAALNAVRQWVYSPTHLNGEPVEVMAPIEVNFTLAR